MTMLFKRAVTALFVVAAVISVMGVARTEDGMFLTNDMSVRSGAHQAQGYDVLPLRYEEMTAYDKIAMEPFKSRYDQMSLAEKAEVYSRQFEYMRNRKPNFDPALFEERRTVVADVFVQPEVMAVQSGAEAVDFGVSGGPAPEYDVLPMRFEEMTRYDKIAMEPYKSKYDHMSVAEKADVYSRQFEYMRNRKPNFDPAIFSALEIYQETKMSPSAYDAKRHLYKPATPKKRRPKPRPQPEPADGGQQRRATNLLEALPGPWESVPEPEPEPEPVEVIEVEEEEIPVGPEYQRDGLRMENLRQGWNAIDVMRGSRRR